MGTAQEVDIDRLVDYRREYGSYIKKARITGNQMVGLCPFHDDRNCSFSADLATGKWHCFAEDRGGNFTQFYAELKGLDTKDAYREILSSYGVEPGRPDEKPKKSRSYSLKQYALEKRLPEEWLAEYCHVSTDRERRGDGASFLRVPYLDENGKEATFRKRFADKDFRWRAGSSGRIILYGEWLLDTVRAAKYAVLVEGESDSQSLWYMGISALGVPGASMFKPQMCDRLQDLRLYIHKEPDQGGDVFLRKVTQALRDGGFLGETYVFSCSRLAGCKDPSDVYIKFGREDGAGKIRQLLEHAEKLDVTAPEAIPEAVGGEPVTLRQPEGWQYSEHGISMIEEKKYTPTLVCRTPIILTKRLRSLETGEEKIEIAFKRDGTWHSAVFPRSTIFTARGVTALSDLGCTVTSENAKNLVRFFAALEAENIDILEKADSTSTFGWQPGRRFIPGNDKGIVLDIDPTQRANAAAYCKRGTLEGWIATMEPHRGRDKFRFILAAGFAAPLLRIIKQRIFFVYNWGGSKTGKTAGLKAALSAWGDPERLMVSFNATQVGLERMAALYCDLPLGIDERQLAGKDQGSLEKIVYMIASGTGKIRGAKGGGLQATQQWRTVALATGEEPISTETSQTGVSTRVLEIYGGPFPDERSAGLMHQKAPDDCGWAGPEFIRWLVTLDERSICDRYGEMLDFVSGVADGKSGSHVGGVAAVALADAMVDMYFFRTDADGARRYQKPDAKPRGDPADGEGFGFGPLEIPEGSWERAKTMAAAILQEQMAADAGDVNENAVQYVQDWVISNKVYFGERAMGTCLGFMSESGRTAYIFPSVLRQALEKGGYSNRKTMRYMAEKGLITQTERKDHKGAVYTVPKRFNNRLTRFIEFHLWKLSETYDPLEEDGGEAAPASAPEPEQTSFVDKDGFMKLPEQAELPFD